MRRAGNKPLLSGYMQGKDVVIAEVETATGLLIMALQDLHDGECAMTERLPGVCRNLANEELRAIVERDAQRSAGQRDALAGIVRGLGAACADAKNIWLRAILDDADNDAETIARGPLRDIALVGALRKGKQSQRVSYETAIALARGLGTTEAEAALCSMTRKASETDKSLATWLSRLTDGLQSSSRRG